MRRNGAPLATGIAILTLLATITSPLCGPLCAKDKGCAGMAPQGSEGTDCHHAAMASETDAPQTHFVAARPCAYAELPAATLNPSKNWDDLRQIQTSATPSLHAIARTAKFPSSFGTDHARWRRSSGLPRTPGKVVETIALRI
jgi:hypothetical protein